MSKAFILSRRALAACAFLVLAVPFALGQAPVRGAKGGQGPAKQAGRAGINFARFGKGLLSKIDLTPDQKQEIMEAARPRIRALNELNKAPGDAKSKQKARAQILRSLQRDIESILTPVQRRQLAQLIREQRLKRQQQRGGGLL